MQSTTRAAHKRRHLSRHERQRQARAEAFSRRTMTVPIVASPVRLATEELELIDRLVRRDRTAVSTALLAIAGIGACEASRQAVLARIAEAACWAQAEGAISSRRAEQIARHVKRAIHRNRFVSVPDTEHAARGIGRQAVTGRFEATSATAISTRRSPES